MQNTQDNSPKPPIAPRKPQVIEVHGKTWEDPYYWLREKNNPEVISYLEAENAYTKEMMVDTEELQKELYEEMKTRIKETDSSAPVQVDEYFYYTRTEEGKEYPIFCRKHDNLENDEEVLLDQNALAKQYKHCGLGAFEVSPDHNMLAYSVDTNGSESYSVFVKNLETGETVPQEIENASGGLEWMRGSTAFVYVTLDEAKRPYKVFLHHLGESPEDDRELHGETDERFFVGVSKSKSEQYIFIEMGSKETAEVLFFDAGDTNAQPAVVAPREQGHEYFVEHCGDEFFVLTNEHAKNFKLMKTKIDAPGKENWEEIIPASEEIMLEDFEVFENFLCVYELTEGVIKVRIRNFSDGSEYYIDFNEEIYAVGSGANPNFKAAKLRLVYSSFVTPRRVFDYDMNTHERTLVKEEEVLGGYDPSLYAVERVYARAEDGTDIPISLAYKKDTSLDGSAPCWLVGYGAYGMCQFPGFRKNRISLLDRGFVFAVAHVRGGGERGRYWYESGKYLNKKNTFTDFIAAAEYLIAHQYTSSQKLLAYGGSAGGMLIGAVANMRPDLFRVMIAAVPFVDCVNTMLDPTIPLTVIEYEEWGNPNDLEYFEYMNSYSPYDNVREQEYPHMLVTAGLNDPRVQYWEPAKWTAKLRATKTDGHLLLLKTEMEQGHSGASGRYKFLEEIALEYAFVLKCLAGN